jgi:hypothetical protein
MGARTRPAGARVLRSLSYRCGAPRADNRRRPQGGYRSRNGRQGRRWALSLAARPTPEQRDVRAAPPKPRPRPPRSATTGARAAARVRRHASAAQLPRIQLPGTSVNRGAGGPRRSPAARLGAPRRGACCRRIADPNPFPATALQLHDDGPECRRLGVHRPLIKTRPWPSQDVGGPSPP